MQIKEITTKKEFYKLGSIWDILLQQSGSNTIFSTFEWLSAWWEHFGQDKELFILLAKENEEIVGIAPLMAEKRKILRIIPIKVISFLGTGISDYADIIIIREREKVLRLFLEYLKKNKDSWDLIDLREIREDSPNLEIIMKESERLDFISNAFCIGKCPYIKVNSDWNSYYLSLSSNFRQDIRTQYNHLEKSGLLHSFSSKEMDIEVLLNSLINIHLNDIASKNKTSFLKTEMGRNFLKEIINKFEKQGWIRINMMHINDKIAAYALGFKYGNKYYYWNIGKDNNFSHFSPGKLLLQHMLKEKFLKKSIEEFDLLRGEEDYKYRWTKLEKENYQINIFNNSFYTRAVFKMHEIFHSMIKKSIIKK